MIEPVEMHVEVSQSEGVIATMFVAHVDGAAHVLKLFLPFAMSFRAAMVLYARISPDVQKH